MKKIIIAVIIVAGLGMLLGVPSQTVTNTSYRSGEIAALQQSFSNHSGDCIALITNATGLTSVDITNEQDRNNWLSGCQYVQDLLK